MTDFTEVFHNGECLSRSEGSHHFEYFVVEDCLCCVSYYYGLHKFNLEIIQGEQRNHIRCRHMLSEMVKELFPEWYQDSTELRVRQIDSTTYGFYFIEEEL